MNKDNKQAETEPNTAPSVSPRKFYVVQPMGEDIEQISVGFDNYEDAKRFKSTNYHKKTYPTSYIIADFYEG